MEIVHPQCSSCSLAGRRIVWGSKPKKAKFMFIGECPEQVDVAKNMPFSGEGGKLLKACLKLNGVDINDCHFTYALMCKPNKRAEARTDDMMACNSRLLHEILMVEPERVLLLGDIACRSVLGRKLLGTRGIPKNIGGVDYLPTYNPEFVMNFPDVFRDFKYDLEKFIHKSLKPRLPIYPHDDLPVYKYELLLGEEYIHYMNSLINNPNKVSKFDIETSSFDPKVEKLLAFGLKAAGETEVKIIPANAVLGFRQRKELFVKWLESENKKVIHNLQFEHSWMKEKLGVERIVNAEDTMLMHYAIDERSGNDDDGVAASHHSLKTLGTVYGNIPDWSEPMKPYKDDYSLAPQDILYRYLAIDVAATEIVYDDILNDLEWVHGERPYREAMIDVAPVLADMGSDGVKVDVEYLEDLDKQWDKEIEEKINDFRKSIGVEGINIRSPKQVSAALYDLHGLPVIPKYKRGTGKDVIPAIKDKLIKLGKQPPEFLDLLLEIRSQLTIQSTYIKGIPKLLDVNNYAHTNFLIHGSDTGRLASRKPNLQNIPARIGPVIRDAFITEDNETFVDSDYKQLEFRILAMLSKDDKMIEFLNNGRDIHSEIAVEYFGIPYGTETDQQRIDAKAVVFGIMFGRTAASIAEEYKLTMAEAERRIAIYNNKFPGVYEWVNKQIHQALTEGYVETYFGHRRRFPLVTRRNKADIQRYAVNSSIQGTASTINTLGAGRVKKRIPRSMSRPVIVVHDSLVQIAYDIYLDEVLPLTKEIMEENLYDSPVALPVDIKIGKRWGSGVKWKQ